MSGKVMSTTVGRLFGAAVIAAGLALAGSGFAVAEGYGAGQQRTQPGGQAQTQQTGITEQDLKKYAAAAVRVQEIGARYDQMAQQAGDAEQAEQIRQQSRAEMAQAVRDAGLSIEKYNEIYTAAQQDPALRGEIARYMEEVR